MGRGFGQRRSGLHLRLHRKGPGNAACRPHLPPQSQELDAALEALRHAAGGTPESPQCLQGLEISAAAFFVLPDGALVPTALLAATEGQRLLRALWPGAQAAAAPNGMLVLRWPACRQETG